jgi:hypothetical protein
MMLGIAMPCPSSLFVVSDQLQTYHRVLFLCLFFLQEEVVAMVNVACKSEFFFNCATFNQCCHLGALQPFLYASR